VSRKLNKKDFIKRAKQIHGDKYDYSLVEYKTNKTKVKIICHEHGLFEQIPSNHMLGQNCPLCANILRNVNNKLTLTDFLNKANEVHKDKYDYSLVDYKHSKLKVKLICKEHGDFEQTPQSHLDGRGCAKCGLLTTIKKESLGKNKFIKKAKEVHNEKYDYSLVDYVHSKEKVKIICPKHGVFEQIPNSHMHGRGCPKCAIELNAENLKSNTKEFIKKAMKVHGDKYDYSLVDYKHGKLNVKLICKKHGVFKQTPANHINNKQGCPICKESKGERKIRHFLKKINIEFEIQKRFEDCRYKKTLPFDFYLPKHNMLIEYDGMLHFKAIDYFGGKEGLKRIQESDKIKNQFAKDNNIKLLRIRYNENIEEILKKKLWLS
jgi:hypothetical protein